MLPSANCSFTAGIWSRPVCEMAIASFSVTEKYTSIDEILATLVSTFEALTSEPLL